MKTRKYVIPIILLVTLLVFELAIFSIHAKWVPFKKIPTGGKISVEGVDVFYDEALTQNVTALDWGTVTPGHDETWPLWILNSGNVNATIYLFTGNYSSQEVDQYLSLTWDYTGATIPNGTAIPVELILTIDPQIGISTKYFNFDILITIEDNE